jgi:APA family basic amino acid/polyamine antiporter
MALVTGGWGAVLVSIAMALSIVVTLNGTIMSGARIPFAAARDKLFFAQMAHIDPRFQSPSTSLIVQAFLATALLLAVGRFQQLFELAIFAEWLFYMLTATTVFVYRKKLPNAVRPYTVWGYPMLPALFVVAAGILLFYSYAENLKNSLIGTGIILLGVPLFGLLKRQRSR